MKIFKLLLMVSLVSLITLLVLKKTSTLNRPYIEYAKVEKSSVRSSLFMSGIIVFKKQARLSAEVVATVKSVLVEEGDLVKAGQSLIILDNEELEQELKRLKIQVDSAKARIKRSQSILKIKDFYKTEFGKLLESKSIDVHKFVAASSDVTVATIDLELATNDYKITLINYQLKLNQAKKTKIVAPISGAIINIPIEVGETAVSSSKSIAGSTLLVIADLKSYEVRASVSEFDIERIHRGSKVKIRMRSSPGKAYLGRIVNIGQTIEQDLETVKQEDKRTISITVEFNDKTLSLIGGASCDMEVVKTESENSLTVPVGALLKHELVDDKRSYMKGKIVEYYVFIVSGKIATKRKVIIGADDGYNQIIIEGVSLEETIIAGPASFLSTLKQGDSVAYDN